MLEWRFERSNSKTSQSVEFETKFQTNWSENKNLSFKNLDKTIFELISRTASWNNILLISISLWGMRNLRMKYETYIILANAYLNFLVIQQRIHLNIGFEWYFAGHHVPCIPDNFKNQNSLLRGLTMLDNILLWKTMKSRGILRKCWLLRLKVNSEI